MIIIISKKLYIKKDGGHISLPYSAGNDLTTIFGFTPVLEGVIPTFNAIIVKGSVGVLRYKTRV